MLAFNTEKKALLRNMMQRERTCQIVVKSKNMENNIFIHSNIAILNTVSAVPLVLSRINSEPHISEYDMNRASELLCFALFTNLPKDITNIIAEYATTVTKKLFTRPAKKKTKLASYKKGNNLIVVTHCKFAYWQSLLKNKFPKLTVRYLIMKSDFSRREDMDLTKYDIVLINANKLQKLLAIQRKNETYVTWDRVVIDEAAQECSCTDIPLIPTRFLWYIQEQSIVYKNCFKLCGYAMIRKLSRDDRTITVSKMIQNFTIPTRQPKTKIRIKKTYLVVPDNSYHKLFALFNMYSLQPAVNDVNNWTNVLLAMSCNATIEHFVKENHTLLFMTSESRYEYSVEVICGAHKCHINRNILLLCAGYLLDKFLNASRSRSAEFEQVYTYFVKLERILIDNTLCVFCAQKNERDNATQNFICIDCENRTGFSHFDFKNIHRIHHSTNFSDDKSFSAVDFDWDWDHVFVGHPKVDKICQHLKDSLHCVVYVRTDELFRIFQKTLGAMKITFSTLCSNVTTIMKHIHEFTSGDIRVILRFISQPAIHLPQVEKIYIAEPTSGVSELVARTVQETEQVEVYFGLYENENVTQQTLSKIIK